MKIPPGREVYACDALPILARGAEYANEDLIAAWKRVQPILDDVAPKKDDLAGRTTKLSEGCPDKTSIELRALYLPSGWSRPPASRSAAAPTNHGRTKP